MIKLKKAPSFTVKWLVLTLAVVKPL